MDTMEFPIEHEAFAGRGLAVRTTGLFKSPRLLVDIAEVKGERLKSSWVKFSVRDNSGIEREIRLKSNGYDPVPTVEIDGEMIILARPLAGCQIILIGLPFIVLVFFGLLLGTVGVGLGVIFGLLAIFASARVFRSDLSKAAKYGLSTLVALGAIVAHQLSFFFWTLLYQLLS